MRPRRPPSRLCSRWRRPAGANVPCPPVIFSSPSAHSAVIHGLYADTVRRRGRRPGPPHAWTDRHERTRKDDRTMITTTTTRDAPMPRPRLAALTRLAALHWPRLALGAVLALAALLHFWAPGRLG